MLSSSIIESGKLKVILKIHYVSIPYVALSDVSTTKAPKSVSKLLIHASVGGDVAVSSTQS